VRLLRQWKGSDLGTFTATPVAAIIKKRVFRKAPGSSDSLQLKFIGRQQPSPLPISCARQRRVHYSQTSIQSGPGTALLPRLLTKADSNDTVGFAALAPTILRVLRICTNGARSSVKYTTHVNLPLLRLQMHREVHIDCQTGCSLESALLVKVQGFGGRVQGFGPSRRRLYRHSLGRL
jgi:hypothetical protein